MSLLIALDIDGTTINHAGELSPRVRDAVAAVRRAGHTVVLATGRAVHSTLPIARELGITDGWAVCSNGAVTLRWDTDRPEGYEIVETVTFDPAPVLALLRDTWPDAQVALEEVGVGHRLSGPFPEGELEGRQTIESWNELSSRPVTRLTFRSPTGTAEDFLDLVEKIGLHEVSYAVGFTAWLDITPEGVSKASALEAVRVRLGVEPADTVAVGDQRNDLEMLAWAGRGVAMGQAPPQVQDAADEITGTVDEDGLAMVLEPLAQAPAEAVAPAGS